MRTDHGNLLILQLRRPRPVAHGLASSEPRRSPGWLLCPETARRHEPSWDGLPRPLSGTSAAGDARRPGPTAAPGQSCFRTAQATRDARTADPASSRLRTALGRFCLCGKLGKGGAPGRRQVSKTAFVPLSLGPSRSETRVWVQAVCLEGDLRSPARARRRKAEKGKRGKAAARGEPAAGEAGTVCSAAAGSPPGSSPRGSRPCSGIRVGHRWPLLHCFI